MTESRLVHIVDDVPEHPDGEGPVLLVALEGFLDAGNASALAAAFAGGPDRSGRVVASFELDELYDYRARRPPLTFAADRYQDYDRPRLLVRSVTDEDGMAYLVLSGPEPDFRWEAFALGVRRVVERLGVRLVVSLGSVPMAVPHTRPVQLTNHATSPELLVQQNIWTGTIRVPASAQALLEVRLGEWGHPAMGFVAHIPHYVAQADYPQASVTLLEAVQSVAGLRWDLTTLREAGEARQVELATQIADSDEVREVVHGLEQQYDAFNSGSTNLLAEGAELPSGDELGAQFEQFLARLDRPEED